jgi:excisionase family DNA binding protein
MGGVFFPVAHCGNRPRLPPMDEHQRFMLIGEVAREARVSVSSVRHWLQTGKLPFVRPGRRVMVRREDFERFLRAPTNVTSIAPQIVGDRTAVQLTGVANMGGDAA